MKRGYPVEVLWCGNGRSNGWSFPARVRRHLEELTRGKSVLHLFGGRATWGVRLDVDPITRPDVIGDAWLPPFRRDSFDVVILDPPYRHVCMEEKAALFRAAGWIAREQVIWFSTVWVSSGYGLKTEGGWLVRAGDNCFCRCLILFRVVSKDNRKPHFTRGPAIRYNRWIAQPRGLPLSGSV